MNKADFLMASLRQLAATAVGGASRGGPHNAPAKEGKDKAAQFLEQLRLVSQGAKHGAKPAAEAAEAVSIESTEDAVAIADTAAAPIPTRAKNKLKQPHDSPRRATEADTASPPHDWRGPEAALSAAMSKLEHMPKPVNDANTARVDAVQAHGTRRASQPMPGEPADAPSAPSDQNVKLSVGAAEPRGVAAVKVVVRQQETHFEPVPQLTQLQKIVDRVATDLPAAAAPADSEANAALPNAPRVADKPVKILTVQLDPPSLGTVTVKVRLTGDSVDVQVSAERYETTQMLRHERDALTERMHSAGYKFEISSIDHGRVGDAAAAGQTSSRSDHQQSSQQQAQGGAQIGGNNADRHSGDAQAGARQGRQGHEQFAERVARSGDQESAPDRTGGALYL